MKAEYIKLIDEEKYSGIVKVLTNHRVVGHHHILLAITLMLIFLQS